MITRPHAPLLKSLAAFMTVKQSFVVTEYAFPVPFQWCVSQLVSTEPVSPTTPVDVRLVTPVLGVTSSIAPCHVT